MLKIKKVFTLVLSLAIVVGLVFSVPMTSYASGFGSSDFLKTNGTVIKNNSGSGSIVTLRGTNLGGWLTQECWMSPIGWFAVPRTGWSVSTSVNGATAGNAIDGDGTTSWNTGTAQAPGQWFKIDMGRQQTFNRIYVDAGSNAGGYPAGYQVLVSNDQTNWTDVASSSGSAQNTVIRFAPQVAQYIKVVQTGSSANWWYIAEINVFSDAVYDRSSWTASASSTEGGGSPQNAIDGNQNTRWSTGTVQASGQWFQVDMGANQTFNQIVLDSGPNSTGDYAHGYTVQVSYDATNWTQVASGQGGGQQLPINFPVANARYIKITQTGSSGNWWSIAEFNIYLNLDDYSMYECLKTRFGSTTTECLLSGYKNTWLQSSDLDNIKNMGMNFVRLPISWHELLNDDGTWKSNPWTYIDWLVDQCSQRDIYVLLDLHTVPGGDCPWGSSGQQGPNPNGFWTQTAYQDMANTIWQGIAAHYVGNPAVAGYDLLNEPLLSYNESSADVTTKSNLYNRLYNTVRAVDPDHIIMMEAFLVLIK